MFDHRGIDAVSKRKEDVRKRIRYQGEKEKDTKHGKTNKQNEKKRKGKKRKNIANK